MEELLARVWSSLVGGLTGPLVFRFILQPLVAVLLAIRAGLRDAREGRSPFLWALVTDHGHRREHVSRGWADVGKLFVAAMLVDFAYQLVVNDRVYLLQSLLVAIGLAFVPYLLLCGVQPDRALARPASEEGIGLNVLLHPIRPAAPRGAIELEPP